VELEEKVSDDSGRHDILLRLLLDGTLFCLQYHIVSVVAVRTLTQSQFLTPGRVKHGEERRGDSRHSLLFVENIEIDPAGDAEHLRRKGRLVQSSVDVCKRMRDEITHPRQGPGIGRTGPGRAFGSH